MTRATGVACVFLVAVCTFASRAADGPLPVVDGVALQPLAAQVRAVTEAMEFLGAPLPEGTREKLEGAYRTGDAAEAVRAIQAALDPLCLAGVEINPEARVKVSAG